MDQKPNSDVHHLANSVANLQIKIKKNKKYAYEPSIDLVNSNVYTKFGLMLFIHSQDIEQKHILTLFNQGG